MGLTRKKQTEFPLRLPALIIVGVFNMLYGITNLLFHWIPRQGSPEAIPPQFRNDVGLSELWKKMQQPDPVSGTIASLLLLLIAGLIVWGGVSMLRLKSYGVAVIASIVSMAPCLTCLGCVGAGQIVGIWALVVLLNFEVRSQFQ